MEDKGKSGEVQEPGNFGFPDFFIHHDIGMREAFFIKRYMIIWDGSSDNHIS